MPNSMLDRSSSVVVHATDDARPLTTREVIVELIGPHHQYLHRALPLLQQLASKVSRQHGDRDPALAELARLVNQLSALLFEHLEHEERSLFPMLLDQRTGDPTDLLRNMAPDHEELRSLIALIRTTAHDYVVPAWASTTCRTLFSALADLERSLLEVVEVENQMLVPRFLPGP